MATLENLRQLRFTGMRWEEQLEHIKAIRAKRRKKGLSKTESKRLDKAIEALSQEEIAEVRRVLQETRAREAQVPTQHVT